MIRRPARKNVAAAAKRLAGHIHHTPILSSRALSAAAGVEVVFKCENLQRSGSFKFRGAMNTALSLPASQRAQGLITHSSGNHGAALAAVAQLLDIPATVVMPRNASKVKRASIRRYRAQVVGCGATLASRERTLAGQLKTSNSNYVPPYDHAHVIAGQGTTALEVQASQPNVDELWVPVGGGGLASGCVAAVGDQIQIVGAEPVLANDAFLGLQAGHRQAAKPPRTIADGLRTALGVLNFAMLSAYGLPVYLVSEAEIVAAQALAMSCLKLVIEPSSAVPLAALLKYGAHHVDSQRVCIVITGGNLNLAPIFA